MLEETEFFKWDGNYIKVFYEVLLPDGEKVRCWPNANAMNSVDGTDRKWTKDDDEILVRVAPDQKNYE